MGDIKVLVPPRPLLEYPLNVLRRLPSGVLQPRDAFHRHACTTRPISLFIARSSRGDEQRTRAYGIYAAYPAQRARFTRVMILETCDMTFCAAGMLRSTLPELAYSRVVRRTMCRCRYAANMVRMQRAKHGSALLLRSCSLLQNISTLTCPALITTYHILWSVPRSSLSS